MSYVNPTYIAVPANVFANVSEDAATEGARRNIAMAHILRNKAQETLAREKLASLQTRYDALRAGFEAAYGRLAGEFLDDFDDQYHD